MGDQTRRAAPKGTPPIISDADLAELRTWSLLPRDYMPDRRTRYGRAIFRGLAAGLVEQVGHGPYGPLYQITESGRAALHEKGVREALAAVAARGDAAHAA